MGGESGTVHRCGLTEIVIFVLALVSGTACSICSKTMMELHGVGVTGNVEVFEKPIFQTLGMFVGMLFGLVMHGAVVFFEIPFPGYDFGSESPDEELGLSKKKYATEADSLIPPAGGVKPQLHTIPSQQEESSPSSEKSPIPVWMYFFLAIPSIFDLGATALCMMGLRYIDVSIYQLLRGSGIIFVALMKQHILRDKLFGFQWVGVVWNVVSVCLVGTTAILAFDAGASKEAKESGPQEGEALLGVVLVLCGAFVQACQFVFEEKVMTMDIPSPPLLLIGMEGLWGTVLCLTVVYPLVYYLPGSDHGSYEDPWNTWEMFRTSTTIQFSFMVYFLSVFLYNLFAVLVTFMLNSVWHAILDNFRPITVWGTDLFTYYVIYRASSTQFGEPWTHWSYLQLLGMVVLLYGTAVYNAPNAGSIRLEGRWWDLFLDFRGEYREIEQMEEEARLDAHWENMQQKFLTKKGTNSFYGERSPFQSVHTQALRGLASPKI